MCSSDLIDYLRTENQVLREKLGKKGILLNDDQRRRMAVKGKFLGREISVALPISSANWILRQRIRNRPIPLSW